MSKLKVPLYRQPRGSVTCGAIAAQMILEYYGVKMSEQELCKRVPMTKFGSFTPDWGMFFMREGFDVEIITQNPKLFSIRQRGKKPAQLKKELRERLNLAKTALDKASYRKYIEYLEAGGMLSVRIPNEQDLQDEIRHGRPLLAELTSNWLSGKRRSFNFHFHVVTGIDKNHVYVNDPLWDSTGGKQKHLIQDFLFSMYAASHWTPDEGALMKIRKRKD